MKWWRRWRRWLRQLEQEELIIRVVVSKQLLDEGEASTADLVATVARDNARRAVRQRMRLVST